MNVNRFMNENRINLNMQNFKIFVVGQKMFILSDKCSYDGHQNIPIKTLPEMITDKRVPLPKHFFFTQFVVS